MATEIESSTEIDAPPETVWKVLTNLPEFARWNPFIRNARGSMEVGGEVHVHVRPPLGLPLRFRATVTERDEKHAIRWHGHVLADWFAAGDHIFKIEELPGGRARFTQKETFTGILPWLGKRLLTTQAKAGFDAMNHALAARSEAAR